MTSISIEIPATLSLRELCERCSISGEFVIGLVELGIIEPIDNTTLPWQFTLHDYLRVRRALRLQRDLSLNGPGVALVLDLLDEMQSMRNELEHLRAYFERE